MLKTALSGNSRTIMMAAISPASDNFEETTSTLLFAKNVKMIKTTPMVNVTDKNI